VSEVSQGPGWWLASDGRWYPPEQAPGYVPRVVSADSTAWTTPDTQDVPPSSFPVAGERPGVAPPAGIGAAPTTPSYPPPGMPGMPGPVAGPPPAYGYPPQQPPPYYPYPPNGYYPDGRIPYQTGPVVQARQTNPFAIASLVCACVGIIPFIGLLGVILGFIFGLIAKSQIKQTGGAQEGGGLATAGIIISLVITALWIILWIVLATSTNQICTDGNC